MLTEDLGCLLPLCAGSHSNSRKQDSPASPRSIATRGCEQHWVWHRVSFGREPPENRSNSMLKGSPKQQQTMTLPCNKGTWHKALVSPLRPDYCFGALSESQTPPASHKFSFRTPRLQAQARACCIQFLLEPSRLDIQSAGGGWQNTETHTLKKRHYRHPAGNNQS